MQRQVEVAVHTGRHIVTPQVDAGQLDEWVERWTGEEVAGAMDMSGIRCQSKFGGAGTLGFCLDWR